MAKVKIAARIRKRWFFWPAVIILVTIGKLGLICDKVSPAHVGGVETGRERVGRWLADYAMVIEGE